MFKARHHHHHVKQLNDVPNMEFQLDDVDSTTQNAERDAIQFARDAVMQKNTLVFSCRPLQPFFWREMRGRNYGTIGLLK